MPLTPKILSNPKHKFVKTLIYIYSMQTFIFTEMNKASRDKDFAKIEIYGPFASALGYIIQVASLKKQKEINKKKNGSYKLYRGMKMNAKELR